MASARDTGSGRVAASHLLLEHLEPHELERLMAFARSQRHPAGEVIFHKGDPGISMMSIVEGRVKISVASPDGKEAVLAVLGPGEVLGEMAIIEDKDRSADATALDACELLVLQKRDFIPFLERNPAICIRLLRILCERLRRTSELIEDRTFLSLPARLAKTLLDLADTGGHETEDGMRVDFNMSQKNFGGLLGASRESVNKQLHAWQSEGLLTIGRGYVVLIRPDDLGRVVTME
jgi:CRP-like cAMP-binding protein